MYMGVEPLAIQSDVGPEPGIVVGIPPGIVVGMLGAASRPGRPGPGISSGHTWGCQRGVCCAPGAEPFALRGRCGIVFYTTSM